MFKALVALSLLGLSSGCISFYGADRSHPPLQNITFSKSLSGWSTGTIHKIGNASVAWSPDSGGCAKITVSGAPAAIDLSQALASPLKKGDAIAIDLRHTTMKESSYWQVMINRNTIASGKKYTEGTEDCLWVADRDYPAGSLLSLYCVAQSDTFTTWFKSISFIPVTTKTKYSPDVRTARIKPEEPKRMSSNIVAAVSHAVPAVTNAGLSVKGPEIKEEVFFKFENTAKADEFLHAYSQFAKLVQQNKVTAELLNEKKQLRDYCNRELSDKFKIDADLKYNFNEKEGKIYKVFSDVSGNTATTIHMVIEDKEKKDLFLKLLQNKRMAISMMDLLSVISTEKKDELQAMEALLRKICKFDRDANYRFDEKNLTLFVLRRVEKK